VVIPHAFFIVEDQNKISSIRAVASYVCRMTKIEKIRIVSTEDSGAPMATAVTEGIEIRIPLKGLIDVAEERIRLNKAMGKVQKDLDFLTKKLNNQKFVSRAPEAVVQKERAKKSQCEQEILALKRAFEELSILE
jgi:valyl-tRNA synthetase